MKIALSIVAILLMYSPNLAAQDEQPSVAAAAAAAKNARKIDPEKEKDIRQLLELTGAKERMAQVMTDMEKSIKPLMTKALPAGDYQGQLIDAFFAKFHAKLNLQELLDLAVPIYNRHFSDDEIKGLLAFYKTPLGQKTLTELPQLTSELMSAGQKWGQEAGRTSMMEVLAEHPEFQKSIEGAQSRAQHP